MINRHSNAALRKQINPSDVHFLRRNLLNCNLCVAFEPHIYARRWAAVLSALLSSPWGSCSNRAKLWILSENHNVCMPQPPPSSPQEQSLLKSSQKVPRAETSFPALPLHTMCVKNQHKFPTRYRYRMDSVCSVAQWGEITLIYTNIDNEFFARQSERALPLDGSNRSRGFIKFQMRKQDLTENAYLCLHKRAFRGLLHATTATALGQSWMEDTLA